MFQCLVLRIRSAFFEMREMKWLSKRMLMSMLRQVYPKLFSDPPKSNIVEGFSDKIYLASYRYSGWTHFDSNAH